MEYEFRRMTDADIMISSKRVTRDFPPAERGPAFAIRNNLKRGLFEGFVLAQGEYQAAYCINVVSTCEKYVLLNYIAVDAKTRGQGTGTLLLDSIKRQYHDKQALICEVERPESADNLKEREQRTRRISYYEKNGFSTLDGVDYSIFGVPMHLMYWSAVLGYDEVIRIIDKIMKDVYQKFLPKMFWSQVKLTTQ